MMFLLRGIIFAFAVSFLACLYSCDSSDGTRNRIHNPEKTTPVVDRKKIPDMVMFPSGKSVVLGSADSTAPAMERPQMKVVLDYEFYVGKHEVTKGEVSNVLDSAITPKGWSPQAKVRKDSLRYPAVDMTFFDAVLFANAKSKLTSHDTVYTYKSASFDEEGHCKNLEGFAFRPDAEGFRLPTEAEWQLAAERNWNPSGGWNSANSDRALHEVCTAKDTVLREAGTDSTVRREEQFCDMAGNVMEWVNDWLGFFRDTTVTNYAGAVDGGSLGERVLKGGCFSDEPAAITLHSRGDVYTVTSSSRANYVGFRLAFGKIPEPLWMSNDGTVVNDRMVVLAKGSTVGAFVGAYKPKIVFRNDVSGNLAYVDFSKGAPSVEEIRDTLDAYHPDISPDGKYVAFCTGLEGVDGKSSVYVRKINPGNNNLVKRLDVESAAIPRWRVLENGDTVIVYVTSTANNKDESAFLKESTWQVPFAGGKFGSPEKLFDGAYHGGISVDDRLAVSGARLLRAKIAKSGSVLTKKSVDTLWYGGEQACNASLSKDGLKRTLFLDFGGKTGRDFAKSDYGTHEMLLIADSTGELEAGIPAPEGKSFDHSEWISLFGMYSATSSDIAVVTLADGNGAHTRISLVNVKDSSVLDVVEGTEIWHPSFWIPETSGSDSSSVDLDSAGIYYDGESSSKYSTSQLELAYKLTRFWSVYKDVEYISLGSSMTLNAVIDDSLKSFSSLNMAFTLGDIHCFNFLLKKYIYPYASSLKVVSLELSPGMLFRKVSDLWNDVYSTSPGLVYDNHHLTTEMLAIAENAKKQEFSSDMFSKSYIEGTFLLPSNGWGEPEVYADTVLMYMSNKQFTSSMEKLQELKLLADSLDIKFIMNVTPRNPAYEETGAYGYFGPRRVVAENIIEMIKDMGIIVFDENKMGQHDYPDDMAFNTTHLSEKGAIQYTARLDSLLETLK